MTSFGAFFGGRQAAEDRSGCARKRLRFRYMDWLGPLGLRRIQLPGSTALEGYPEAIFSEPNARYLRLDSESEVFQ